jgi:hypothetical protein
MKKLLFLFTVFVMLSGELFALPVDSTTFNSSNITNNITLTNDKSYRIKGFNYIKNGATVSIQPGTYIIGDFNTKGTLIFERGSKIYANGTAGQPIVFTSQKPVGQRNSGDWGGIIILGRAGINTATGVDSAEIEGFGAGLGPIYGGQPRNDADSSGLLRYVRIEFAGINLTGVSGNEINGLTMGGVGSKTVIEYVQVSYSGDDSFEWFGGTVNCKYLVAYKGLDDDWDTDNGFRGKVQFGLSVRDSGYYDVSTSNGFESDNNTNNPVSGSYNGPRTKPVFSNMTVIGPYSSTSLTLNSLWGRGAHQRRASQMNVFNSIVMGWKTGVRFDGNGVYEGANGDSVRWKNDIIAGNVRLADTAASTSFSTQAWLQTGAFGNTALSSASGILTNPWNVYPDNAANVNNWVPAGGSPALTGASFSDANLAGFEVTTYRGALGSGSNWLTGWTQWDPKNYATVSVQAISTEIPSAFKLAQNFPNPFNPSTKINFSIPKAGFVTLKVYDLTGKEVSGLVNENLSIGTYGVDFNAAKLTSGIYFYTLKTENFSETKKMMLIK